jgi:hypothetical protein
MAARSRQQPAWCVTNARNRASLSLHTDLGFAEVGRAASYLGKHFDGGVGVLLRADPPEPASAHEEQVREIPRYNP